MIDYDFTPRHGYVIPISESELQALFDEYGYIDLPDRFSDNPLDSLKLPYTDYGYKIAGNITLPGKIDGYDEMVTWKSDNESVISTTATPFDSAALGDNIIRDIDGKAVIGYCYAPGSDGLWGRSRRAKLRRHEAR